MLSQKDVYRQWSAGQAEIPIFSRPWWLDAVCGEDDWNVILVEEKGVIIASMPYYLKKRSGFRLITMPKLTPTMGPFIVPKDTETQNENLSYEKKVIAEIIRQLPPFDHLAVALDYRLTSWLPFRWAGFKQTTMYSYILENIGDEKAVWAGLRSNIRSDIKKAQGRFGIQVSKEHDLDAFLELSRKTFQRQELQPSYTPDFVRRLDKVCAEHGCRAIFIGEDECGRHHAGNYIVWDQNCAYYLMGGGDPALRNSGATSLCLWEAILFSANVTRSFDFEGSVIESIERYFRAFGGTQVPYHMITKTPSRLLRARAGILELVR